MRSSGLDWVENDLTSLEKVVRRAGGRGERGKATILILALDCLPLVGLGSRKDRRPNSWRTNQGPTWSMVGAFSLMAWTEILSASIFERISDRVA